MTLFSEGGDTFTDAHPRSFACMKKRYTYTLYCKGSIGFHAAVPPQASDGRSGGVPRKTNTPSLHKPAVLATLIPEPSQGTPGTAISAVLYLMGPALPRPQHGDGDVEQPPANCLKALVKRVNAKVKQWRAQIHRYYLAHMRNHLALTTTRTFGYIRLIVFTISLLQRSLFRKSVVPHGATNTFVHDCRYALFRRGAVYLISGIVRNDRFSPASCLGNGGPVSRFTD